MNYIEPWGLYEVFFLSASGYDFLWTIHNLFSSDLVICDKYVQEGWLLNEITRHATGSEQI